MTTPGGPADDDALHRRDDGGIDAEMRIGDATLTCDNCGQTEHVAGAWRQRAVDTWTEQHLSPRLASWTVRLGNQVIDTVRAPHPTDREQEGRVWPPPPPNP